MHIYRWDLDKTYLETDFGSIRGLMRAATESAADKRSVPGAPALIRGLGGQEGARIYILSGSPTQMRAVLEEKLRLDGVRYDGFILKDNLANLRRGRFRAIRGQFGYKLPFLLESRRGIGRGVPETLFGDDAEVDALIYSVYADILAGRLSPAQVSRIMETAGAYPDSIERALSAIASLPTGEAVEAIFIHLEQGSPPARFTPLGPRIVPVYSWWQAALVLCHRDKLSPDALSEVMLSVVQAEAATTWAMAGLAQDLVRRGHVTPDIFSAFDGEIAAACRQAVARVSPPSDERGGLPGNSPELDPLSRASAAQIHRLSRNL